MARTFSLICTQHQAKLDTGTIRLNGVPFIYSTETCLELLCGFLFEHTGCAIVFDDDEKLAATVDGFNDFTERSE